MHRRDIYMLIYLCHLCAYVFMSLICSSMQCLTVHTICKELSPQYYSRFHGPSRDLKVTCPSTLFKRGSVSPSSALSLRILAKKVQVSRVCKNKRLLCIDKSFICLYTYITCVLMYLCHLYAHLCNAWQFTQYAKNSHLNITAGSMIQVIISKGKQVNPKGAVSLHLRLIPSEFMQ